MMENKWVSVTEQLPDCCYMIDEDEICASDSVLVYTRDNNWYIARFLFSHNGNYWVETLDGDEIEGETHWMLLSNPLNNLTEEKE